MSSASEPAADPAAEAAGDNKKSSQLKLVLLATPLLLGGISAVLWFSGVIPNMLGKGGTAHTDNAAAQGETNSEPVFVDMPDIVANLNSGLRKITYVKLKTRLEVGSTADAVRVQAAMPRVLDMFQTYIREMRPEELRGSGGTYRLREELIARANLSAAPARIRDVLFIEVLIQ